MGSASSKVTSPKKEASVGLWKGKAGDGPGDEAGVDYQSSSNRDEKIGLGLDVWFRRGVAPGEYGSKGSILKH